MNKLIIDLDGVYKANSPEGGVIVLTNLYKAEWAIDINKETGRREDIFNMFEQLCKEVSTSGTPMNFDLKAVKIYWFNYFFFPVGQWFVVIEQLLADNKINSNTQVEFTSYSSNSKAFIFEAEGERNGQLLYKKSYFLSYYIREFLRVKGITSITNGKNYTLRSVISYYTRATIVLTAKLGAAADL